MADFNLWGRVEQIDPERFFVIVSSSSPDDPTATQVSSRIASSLEAARRTRDELMVAMGAAIKARGDRVVDVEED